MTREERREFADIRELLSKMAADKFDPENGWKTARAVFESQTVGSLQAIHERLSNLQSYTEKIPALINTVNDIQIWRKANNKALKWLGTSFFAPIVLYVIYEHYLK